jgi:hypothetical protein
VEPAMLDEMGLDVVSGGDMGKYSSVRLSGHLPSLSSQSSSRPLSYHV